MVRLEVPIDFPSQECFSANSSTFSYNIGTTGQNKKEIVDAQNSIDSADDD